MCVCAYGLCVEGVCVLKLTEGAKVFVLKGNMLGLRLTKGSKLMAHNGRVLHGERILLLKRHLQHSGEAVRISTAIASASSGGESHSLDSNLCWARRHSSCRGYHVRLRFLCSSNFECSCLTSLPRAKTAALGRARASLEISSDHEAA